ncbi:hypothetical protein [Bacillus pinisoli]|uniref:hypothetical protein n=1 Tax=Bacillus pinisoli TaxID=2901866 RepID=UPI001FF2253C|nr:hypothetical protein [Bacillus pinisoli]
MYHIFYRLTISPSSTLPKPNQQVLLFSPYNVTIVPQTLLPLYLHLIAFSICFRNFGVTYEAVPGFIMALIVTVVVSLFTQKPADAEETVKDLAS